MEALLKVVIAADNLAVAVEREESTKQFIARFTEYLEDSQMLVTTAVMGFGPLPEVTTGEFEKFASLPKLFPLVWRPLV